MTDTDTRQDMEIIGDAEVEGYLSALKLTANSATILLSATFGSQPMPLSNGLRCGSFTLSHNNNMTFMNVYTSTIQTATNEGSYYSFTVTVPVPTPVSNSKLYIAGLYVPGLVTSGTVLQVLEKRSNTGEIVFGMTTSNPQGRQIIVTYYYGKL